MGGTGATLNNTGAIVSAGDSGAGSLTINGAFTQSGAGTILEQIGGTGAGAFDLLNVSGAATLGGNLEVSLLGGFTPTVGQTFVFLDYGSRVGSGFFSVSSLDSGYNYSVTYGANTATLTVTQSASSAPEPSVWLLLGMGMPLALRRRRRG